MYVYAILPGPGRDEWLGGLDSEYHFSINGTSAGTFTKQAPPWSPTGVPSYFTNVNVYANTSLPFGAHNLTIQAGHKDGPDVLLLLDSIVYSCVLESPRRLLLRFAIYLHHVRAAPTLINLASTLMRTVRLFPHHPLIHPPQTLARLASQVHQRPSNGNHIRKRYSLR